MDAKYGLWLLDTEKITLTEDEVNQVSDLAGIAQHEVRQVLATAPGEAAFEVSSVEEAGRIQDAFTLVGVGMRLRQLNSADDVARPVHTDEPSTEGSDAPAPPPNYGSGLGSEPASGNSDNPVSRWLQYTDESQKASAGPVFGGTTITIPPMGRGQLVAVAGSAIGILGLFAPVIRGPLGSSFSLVGSSSFTALVLFVSFVLFAGLVATRRMTASAGPLVVGAGVVLYQFTRLAWNMIRIEGDLQAMRQDDFLGVSDALFRDVGMGWGWSLLLLGTGLMIYGFIGLIRSRLAPRPRGSDAG